jgi:glycerophosphoryl diester phosphodiesterase
MDGFLCDGAVVREGGFMRDRSDRLEGFTVFAHRGASGHEPENTLRAIRRALSFGTTWVEVDVYCVEGELLVVHGGRLERTTNGTGKVMDRSLAYLRSLDAGKGEKIPFLREVFDAVAGKAGLNVEMKGPATSAPLAAFLNEDRRLFQLFSDRLIVSSLNHEELKRFKILMPSVMIGAVRNGPLPADASFAERLGVVSVHVNKDYLRADFILDAHRRGLKVFAFTVNTREEISRCRALGVDGVFTDFPEVASTGRS